MKIRLAFVAVLATISPYAQSATSFSENFSGTTISPALIASPEFLFGPNSSPTGVAQNPSGNRRYVRTVDTDFSSVDFAFEITLSVNTPTAANAAFVGFGDGQPDLNFFNEPHTSIYIRQFPDDFLSGQLTLTISTGPQTPPNQPSHMVFSGTQGQELGHIAHKFANWAMP
jgi:hypothetical protein